MLNDVEYQLFVTLYYHAVCLAVKQIFNGLSFNFFIICRFMQKKTRRFVNAPCLNLDCYAGGVILFSSFIAMSSIIHLPKKLFP